MFPRKADSLMGNGSGHHGKMVGEVLVQSKCGPQIGRKQFEDGEAEDAIEPKKLDPSHIRKVGYFGVVDKHDGGFGRRKLFKIVPYSMNQGSRDEDLRGRRGRCGKRWSTKMEICKE
ncbi:uncharacterized protein EAE97_008339 [Botrytis byssoidea]|uniref:Uncharacterized protein n=1 Tax=Botrytis byssoidea TaxID=139641 RepID=A0A9P5M2R9_9HELO|nr:uncharacterized protein EAE97_008339 [Botrytis byssoidea]KAF7935432.1 hypothetical protein EAE97_008339 [Botrytis byssoidea]